MTIPLTQRKKLRKMARKQRPVKVEDNGDKAQGVFEHNLVKMGVPVLGFLLVAVVSWLFNTVMELDELIQQHTIHLEHLHMAEKEFSDTLEKMQDMITDLRIHVGRVTAH